MRRVVIGEAAQHRGKSGHAVAILGWEVGARVERCAIRCQEDRHRPAAATGQRLNRVHVERVEIGPLLTIHLDADEEAVHQLRGVLVLERLTFHYGAPMTGCVPYTQENW